MHSPQLFVFVGVTANSCHRSVTLQLSDTDFSSLIGGKTTAQKLFMSGKLKVRGDVMKATRMEPILKRASSQSKL